MGVLSNTGAGDAATPHFCVVDSDPLVRSTLGAFLFSIGCSANVYSDVAEFLLSGSAHRCDGLIAEYPLRGMTPSDLQNALTAAGLSIPTILTVEKRQVDLNGRDASHVKGQALTLEKPILEAALLHAVRHALTQRET